MTCECTDAGRMVWYLQWEAFALAHGHQLLFSTWLFHPSGVNLLTDTSVPALGVLLAPVTLVFTPVVSFNLAVTLIPVATSLSMFWLLRRWVRWTPAAFVGGLLYGLTAATIGQLADGWLNLACTALLPVIVGCLDDLVARRRHRPVVVGGAMGFLLTLQFFISSELLLITVIGMIVALVLLAAYGAWHDRADLWSRLGRVATGLATAAGVGAALLAYPLWFFLRGPASLGTTVWSTNVPGSLGNVISNLWSQPGQYGSLPVAYLARGAHVLGGYAGRPFPTAAYLGVGTLGVIVVGSALWYRDRRLWLFGAVGVVSICLSLRVTGRQWGPWSLVYHLSLIRNVVQSRFSTVFLLCAAVMVGLIVDHARTAVVTRATRRTHRDSESRWTGALVGAVVAAAALGPVAWVLVPSLPVRVQTVTLPRWFEPNGPGSAGGQVVLTYPFATADSQSVLPWQALSGLGFQMVGGGGPKGTLAHAGAQRSAFQVLQDASVPLASPPVPNGTNLGAVRTALGQWGVTTVVVPDDAGLYPYQTARGTAYGVAFFTALLGSTPEYQSGAWVWSGVGHAPPAHPVTTTVLDACVARSAGQPVAIGAVSRCVLGS